jgi:hypothetical protein
METLIDSKDYYVESRKAIDIALAKENQFMKKLDPEERLEVYNRYLKETKDQKEYLAVKALKDELEIKIKFHDTAEPTVPKADQAKIIRNLEIEQRAVIEKANELKVQLSKLLDTFEKEAIPLLVAIDELEVLRYIPNNIDIILSHEFREKWLSSLSGRFNMSGMSEFKAGREAEARRDLLNKSISYFRNATIPMQEKKLKGGN